MAEPLTYKVSKPNGDFDQVLEVTSTEVSQGALLLYGRGDRLIRAFAAGSWLQVTMVAAR